MTFTSNSDLYAAVHDGGINTIIKYIMRQRPSLFNYGTSIVRSRPDLLCQPIEADPDVTQLITVLPPIPLLDVDIPGSDIPSPNLYLDFVVQLTDLEIDFHPGNVFTTPPELTLGAQHLGFRAKVCAGMSCIPRDLRQKIPIDPAGSKMVRRTVRRGYSTAKAATMLDYTRYALFDVPLAAGRFAKPPQIFIPIKKMECFCLELFGIAHASFEGLAGNQQLVLKVDDLELVDIRPLGLENILECYMELLVDRVIMPQVSDVVSEIAFSLHELPPLPDSTEDLGSIQFSATTGLPNNPAIEEDQLKLFTELEHIELNIPPITIGGGDEPSTPSRSVRARTRTGPSHLTAAISEGTFNRIFEVVRDTGDFKITVAPKSVSILGVTGSAGANIEFHLQNGTVQFQADHTIRIDELDIKWDRLDVTIGIDIPSLCFNECIWTPFGDVCINLGCLFEGDPDFSFTIPLPTAFTTELSINAGLQTYYGTGTQNEWLVYITPSRVDVDLIDIADTVGDLLDSLLDAAISALGLPDWADFLADGLVDLVRGLLDIPDDVGEWLQDLVFDTLGVDITIESYLTSWLADKSPIFRLPDPVEALPAEGPLIAVEIPIQYLNARVDADEMVIEVDVGE